MTGIVGTDVLGDSVPEAEVLRLPCFSLLQTCMVKNMKEQAEQAGENLEFFDEQAVTDDLKQMCTAATPVVTRVLGWAKQASKEAKGMMRFSEQPENRLVHFFAEGAVKDDEENEAAMMES